MSASAPADYASLKKYVESRPEIWDIEQAGDIVYRRIVGGSWGGEGEAVLKRLGWKRSMECQKPSVAVKRLTSRSVASPPRLECCAVDGGG